MFKKMPKILAHVSSLNNGNFVTPEYILNNGGDHINLFKRFCPHRMYPMHEVGDIVQNISCNFHGFEWNKQGIPINNDRKIGCGEAKVGKSGLVFKDFVEPDAFWVDDLAKEELEYSHTRNNKSTGSWLWMMEIQADLLHIRKGEKSVHPALSEVTDLNDIQMFDGDGWILQTCSTGWWLFIYPFTFIEWSPGCVAINYTRPNNIDEEYGFMWNTQFYFNKNISKERRESFEFFIEDVFVEDVATIEKQASDYFPLMKSSNRLEDHCVHFGKWYLENVNKK